MNPDEKTRFVIGSLVAAILLAGGYGLYQTMRPAAPPAAQASSPEAAPTTGTDSTPGASPFRIEAEKSVLAGSKGHEATAVADSAMYYEWSVQGGTLDSPNTNPSITWSAGTGSETVLVCKGTNAAGGATTSTFHVALRRGPGISRFEATPVVITEGSGARLGWSADNLQKLVLDPGGQDVSSYNGPGLEVKPAKTTTFTLTGYNQAGDTTSREVQIKVVPAPEIVSLRTESVPGSLSAATVIGEFKGGKAELKNGGQVLASSEASPLRFRAEGLKEGTTLLFTVTNEARSYVTASLTFSQKKP